MRRDCKGCVATGIYKGFREPEGMGVRCSTCKGKAWVPDGHPRAGDTFTVRNHKDGIRQVQVHLTQDQFARMFDA